MNKSIVGRTLASVVFVGALLGVTGCPSGARPDQQPYGYSGGPSQADTDSYNAMKAQQGLQNLTTPCPPSN
jgi:hypothetical protein